MAFVSYYCLLRVCKKCRMGVCRSGRIIFFLPKLLVCSRFPTRAETCSGRRCLKGETWTGSSSGALLTNEAHPCAKFNKSARSSDLSHILAKSYPHTNTPVLFSSLKVKVKKNNAQTMANNLNSAQTRPKNYFLPFFFFFLVYSSCLLFFSFSLLQSVRSIYTATVCGVEAAELSQRICVA